MKVVIMKKGHGKLMPNKNGEPVEIADAKAKILLGCGVAKRFSQVKVDPTKAPQYSEDLETI